MITEDEVVRAVSEYLEGRGWHITQSLRTTQKGIDLCAVKSTEQLLIEAKGGTSNLRSSARFGKPFSGAQAKDHIGAALWKVGQLLTSYPNAKIAIALPEDAYHRRYAAEIDSLLKMCQIDIYWVNASLAVSLSTHQA